MSKKHDKILQSLFSTQMSGNIHWKEIEALLIHLGAELVEGRGATVVVKLNDHEFTLHRPHHGATMSKNELHHVRNFLGAAGIVD
jgi:hypothetical protein